VRLVVIGCEYAGKSTLIDALMEWGTRVGVAFHWDDHFTIPDRYFLGEADQAAMAAAPPVIKERFQRFQIYYHLEVIADHGDCLLGGFHIEEAIYGPRYYYPENVFPIPYLRKVESKLPKDTILLLLRARPDVIRRRMTEAAHPYSTVPSADVEAVSAAFEHEYGQSWIERRLAIDTSDLTPLQLFETFQQRVVAQLDGRDLLRWRELAGL
jgi:hypothetical protein